MNSYENMQEPLIRGLRSTPEAYDRSRYLVGTDWLAARLGDPQIALFEVSVATDDAEGHIPGAIRLDWRADILDHRRRDVVDRDNLEQLLQSAGVDEESMIVLYGDCSNWFAAFAAWVLNLYGVEDVRLLDGGRLKWMRERRPLTTRFPRPGFGDIRLGRRDDASRAYLLDVLAAVRSPSDAVLVDVRSPDEYNGLRTSAPGEAECALRAGHMPGAVNIPWGRLVDADGAFKPAADLRALFEAEGVDGSAPVITYCRIGERSGHTWFALSRLLGYDARNYDGSWAEYGNAIGVPIENPNL